MAVLAVAAVTAAVVYQSEAREHDYRLLLAQGDAALAAGQTSAAIEDFSGAVALRPDSMLARLRRGETYQQRADLDAAARDFRAAAALDPTAPRPLEQWGDVLYQQKRYRRSAEIYGRRLELDDRSSQTHFRRGLAFYRDHNPTAALTSLARAIELDGGLAEAYYVSGLAWRDLHDVSKATAAMKKAVEIAPASLPEREELAALYREAGQRRAELEQLQALAGLDSGHVERTIAVGTARARSGQVELAILTLGNALEQFPDDLALYGAIGHVWLDVARAHPDRTDALAKALEALERAAASATSTSDVKLWYGQALVQDQQIEAAERVLQQATERFPVNPQAFADYAEVAEQLDHPAAARQALLGYHALVGDDAKFAARAFRIGRLSLQLNDVSTAVYWLRRASTANPGNPSILTALSQANERGQMGVR
jgi:tetratricopeptide (TPR) repeat protein